MEYDFQFIPLKFHESLSDIRNTHLLEIETASADDVPEAGSLVERLGDSSGIELRHMANILRYSEIDMLFQILKKNIDESLKNKVLYILKSRTKRKYFIVNWAMLQNDYGNSNLIESIRLIADCMKPDGMKGYEDIDANLLTDCNNDLLEHTYQVLVKEDESIDKFLEKYLVDRNSRLAHDLCLLYFSKCEKEGFPKNRKVFSEMVNGGDPGSIQAAIANYLSRMHVLKFFSEVNVKILERCKPPAEGDIFWKNAGSELIKKFDQWINVNKMESYFEMNKRKFVFWRAYYKNIINTVINVEAGALFIDFGKFMAVDIRKLESGAFLYAKNTFWIHYDNFILKMHNSEAGEDSKADGSEAGEDLNKDSEVRDDDIPEWDIPYDVATDARDAIIKEAFSDIYVLNFEHVGILYARDLLERELGR